MKKLIQLSTQSGRALVLTLKLKIVTYNRVIIMTDADTDGAHIQVLLLTFFFKYMKPLVQAGRVFIALPPLYKLEKVKAKQSELNTLDRRRA